MHPDQSDSRAENGSLSPESDVLSVLHDHPSTPPPLVSGVQTVVANQGGRKRWLPDSVPHQAPDCFSYVATTMARPADPPPKAGTRNGHLVQGGVEAEN